MHGRRRRGGETGVAAVTCLEEAVWKATAAGLFSLDLAEAAALR